MVSAGASRAEPSDPIRIDPEGSREAMPSGLTTGTRLSSSRVKSWTGASANHRHDEYLPEWLRPVLAMAW